MATRTERAGAGLVVIGLFWAAVLWFVEPGQWYLVGLAAASAGLLAIAAGGEG